MFSHEAVTELLLITYMTFFLFLQVISLTVEKLQIYTLIESPPIKVTDQIG